MAPTLVLLAPFLGFLKFQGYPYFLPEVWLCVAGIALVGLGLGIVSMASRLGMALVLAGALSLFVDVQIPKEFWFHGIGKAVVLAGGFVALTCLLWVSRQYAERVVSAAAATVLVSTLLIPGQPPPAPGEVPLSIERPDLPLIVHVIVDEHIGIDGLPPDESVPGLQADLRTFYHSLGFRTFDAAYSEYAQTEHSLGHVLNFSPGEYRSNLVRTAPGFKVGLSRNEYFSRMQQRGYRLRVVQSDALELCPEAETAACDTYFATRIAAVQDLPLSASEKARLIAGNYLALSKLSDMAADSYGMVRHQLTAVRIHLPRWRWYYRPVSFSGLAQMKKFQDTLAGARRGEMYFAHFMMPHSPLLYDADCALTPVRQWPVGEHPSPQAARATAYVRYDRQVRCTLKMVRDILDAIPSSLRTDAVVVVQGDHGSRLTLSYHGAATDALAAPSEDRDTYSTLFAVRSPGLASGSDRRFVPITCILRSLVESGFQDVPGLDVCAIDPGVFTKRENKLVRRPLAPFTRQP